MFDPAIPSNDPGFVYVPANDGVPLNLYVVPFVKPCSGEKTFITPDEAA